MLLRDGDDGLWCVKSFVTHRGGRFVRWTPKMTYPPLNLVRM